MGRRRREEECPARTKEGGRKEDDEGGKSLVEGIGDFSFGSCVKTKERVNTAVVKSFKELLLRFLKLLRDTTLWPVSLHPFS